MKPPIIRNLASTFFSRILSSILPRVCFNEVMKRYFVISIFLYFCCAFPSHGGEFDAKRHKMVEEVLIDVVANEGLTLSPSVMAAMEKVERHRFVPGWLAAFAYLNRPLPIGHGQTISQPAIVALMTDLLKVKAGDNVLEIGTGSGYQAAVLAEIVKSVYSIEIIEPLEKQAAERLKSLGYINVKVKVSDGYYGWPEAAPFDAIVVTAAASHVPPPLIKQLKSGGRMVIPLGAHFMTQYLMLVEKHADGSVTSRQIVPVGFVPLTGGH
jgi:protein-L-isoaspartate(D-aspartate) O-methyltransferase